MLEQWRRKVNAMYRVLFVDDDEAIGFLVARYRIWKTAGFELADFAYNGREALEKLSAGGIDLIITDIRMPVMDGIEATKMIRRYEEEEIRRYPSSRCLPMHLMKIRGWPMRQA